jgi:DNA-binding NarL/FixJ family response regulator
MTVALHLFLIDEDPVFRLGLKIWLEQQPGYRVIGEASTAADALTQLAKLQGTAQARAGDAAWADASPRADVVVLDLGLGQGDPAQLPGLQLCRDLKQRFPAVPVLVLSAQADPVLQAAAQAMGADGFGLRSLPVRELARLIQQVADPTSPTVGSPASRLLARSRSPLSRLRRSCLQQIAGAIADIDTQQAQKPDLFYGSVLAGQRRELRTARWLIQQILPEDAGTALSSPGDRGIVGLDPGMAVSSRSATPGAITPIPLEMALANVRTRVCEAVFRKLQYPLENSSEIPLEIDILRSDRARELLYTLLRDFEDLLDDLQKAQLPPGQVIDTVPNVLRDLWQKVTTDFFGRYYTPEDSGFEQPVATVLSRDAAAVQQTILNHIPEVEGLLAHLLFEEALIVDGTPYMATTPEALRRSQLILENLLLRTACAVMQPLLNRFADVEALKKGLYQRRMMSSRDIARFRNDLSWRYRWDHLVNDPKAMFESQRRFFTLSPNGIQVQWVYAPRKQELETLGGVPYALTLALEARDAISPRVRAVVALVGSSLVYVLTEVVGRGIGLVGRGVLKGIGSAWQDTRIRRRSRDEV